MKAKHHQQHSQYMIIAQGSAAFQQANWNHAACSWSVQLSRKQVVMMMNLFGTTQLLMHVHVSESATSCRQEAGACMHGTPKQPKKFNAATHQLPVHASATIMRGPQVNYHYEQLECLCDQQNLVMPIECK